VSSPLSGRRILLHEEEPGRLRPDQTVREIFEPQLDVSIFSLIRRCFCIQYKHTSVSLILESCGAVEINEGSHPAIRSGEIDYLIEIDVLYTVLRPTIV
jgi:hypothetical protein